MSVDVKVPSLGESVSTATIAEWKKKPGDSVKQDEVLVVLDSDKASMEVPSPASGVLGAILAKVGDEVTIGQSLATIEAAGAAPAAAAPAAGAAQEAKAEASGNAPSSPSVRRALGEEGLSAADVQGSGKGGRITREDVSKAAEAKSAPVAEAAAAKVEAPKLPISPTISESGEEIEEVVPMTSIRKRIAARLLESKQNTAMLTTFNEVDMSAILALREKYQDRFVKKYGIKLGFMGFFVKAAIEALKAWPSANAEIRGDSIVFKHYYHIGVAVSTERGLVVPVLKNADRLSFAETEKAIADFGERARKGQIGVDELKGGTFTISNGGVFGSLMSTPILNPPQVAILGMHSIQKRPVVVNDEIVIRPMMYLAVSYDHRLLDGREAVSFLVRIKECVENPERVLLEI